jgi:hypothetical protein
MEEHNGMAGAHKLDAGGEEKPKGKRASAKKPRRGIMSAAGRPYALTEKGKVRETQANYEIMLEDEPKWAGKLKFNELTTTIEFDGRPITDLVINTLSSWASHRFQIAGSARRCATRPLTLWRTISPTTLSRTLSTSCRRGTRHLA